MALTGFSGFETGDLGEWLTVVGTPTVVEANGWGAPKTGTYAMRCNTDATTAYVSKYVALALSRCSFYLYIVDTPDIETVILGTDNTTDLNQPSIRLDTDRHLNLYCGGNNLGDSGTTVLAENTWYRISYSKISTAARVYIDGVQELSDIDSDYTRMRQIIGIVATAATADLYFDDFVYDDTDSLVDIGDIRVLRASPNAAGQYAEFDTISGYTYCDEVPADGATTIVDDSGVSTLHRECYNLQDSATIGVSGTINAVNVLVQGYSVNVAQGIIVRQATTDYTTMVEWGKTYTWKNKLYTAAPSTAAWDTDIFDAFQAGGYSEGSKDVYMSCVMVMVAFTPAAVGGWSHKYLGVANASIGKINGVAIASILKVNGIA